MEELFGLFEFVGGVAEFVSNVVGDFFGGGAGDIAEIAVDMIDGAGTSSSPDEEERRRRLLQDSLNRPAS